MKQTPIDACLLLRNNGGGWYYRTPVVVWSRSKGDKAGEWIRRLLLANSHPALTLVQRNEFCTTTA